MTNPQLEADVRWKLERDPRIPAPGEIAVLGDGGILRLRGTVGSFRQRRAAVEDATSIRGVYEVIDDLNVRLEDHDRRLDDELRGVALQTLIWDSEVPSDEIDVNVADGWVTVRGDVDYQFQSDAAFNDIASMRGVVGLTNEIRVVNPGR
ncbi:MAG TPA: BON domain-containing protein [Solirubrobacteraceae bacterium]|jgi:osmotically-inducible protein OsmY|nr:BON domain-containing protein [Solirubrobacteraceae bacterium]